jgi:tetratricopeptide (TPR) repeat protein
MALVTPHRAWLALLFGFCLLPLHAEEKDSNPNKAPPPPDDVPLVKRVMAARLEYQTAMEQLRAHYLQHGDMERVRWVEEELLSFHRISKRAYRLELDVPPPTLQPMYNIPEANEQFRRAMSYKGKGWFSGHDDNLRRAEILFQQILSVYPQCDKIAEVAYQLGEIYESRVFKQYRRAAVYYERSYQWNPNAVTDARLRAARLYDKVLQDRGRAVQLYREVTLRDTDQKRVDEATKRLREMSAAP